MLSSAQFKTACVNADAPLNPVAFRETFLRKLVEATGYSNIEIVPRPLTTDEKDALRRRMRKGER